MKKINCAFAFIFLIIFSIKSYGQDPSFAQFFSSPLNINPALTGNINADWRMIANFRDQWIGPASPYATGTISFDSKIMQNKMLHVEEKNVWAIGAMLMYDKAMSGVQKSAYASLNVSYNVVLLENTNKHSLRVGFGAIYGRRFIDYSRVDFEEQFTGYGFNVNLPTGEAALSNMKPYFSASAGLTYSIKNETSNLDIGVAAFHLNKPKQTFLKDENQQLPMRKVGHINYETFINERVVLNANAIYQYQQEAKYYSFGGGLGYFIGDSEGTLLNAGLWYWSKNAVIPYIGLAYKDMQFGLSYDITISKLRQATPRPKTFEISVILRGSREPSGVIPCPWK